MKTDNQLVRKANALVEASYDLSAVEQKIIIYLASHIKWGDHELQPHSIRIRDFHNICGLKGSPKYTELSEITLKLMSKPVQIKTEDEIVQFNWLSFVRYNRKEGTVSLKFDTQLKPFLLQLKEQFTRYPLRHVLNLKSGYAIRMYEMLKQWETVRQVRFSVDELKRRMRVEDLYKEYFDFKRRVVLPAQKELKSKTDIYFDFQEVKEGRKVKELVFHIHKKQEIAPVSEVLEDLPPLTPVSIMSIVQEVGLTVDAKTVSRWEDLIHTKFGEQAFPQFMLLVKNVMANHSIDNPAGFITWFLQQDKQDESLPQQDIVREALQLFKREVGPLPSFVMETTVKRSWGKKGHSQEEQNIMWEVHGKQIMQEAKQIVSKNRKKRR